MSQKNKVRIAVVGLRHGCEHLDHYRGREDVEIAGLCDTSTARRQRAAATYGVATSACFADYGKMLRMAGLDAVFVMTPPSLHAEMTIQALEAGCHVLVAKSLCRFRKFLEVFVKGRINDKQVRLRYRNGSTPQLQVRPRSWLQRLPVRSSGGCGQEIPPHHGVSAILNASGPHRTKI